MQICKKITVAGINEVRGGFKNVTEVTHVARVFGVARSVENKSTTLGNSLQFNGDFRAINADGEEFAGPVLYLMSPADGMLSEAILGAEGKEVKFGFDIYVAPHEKKTAIDIGYSYQIKPLLELKPSDAMASLMAEISIPLPGKPKQAALVFEEAKPEPTPAAQSEEPAAEKPAQHPKKK